MRQTFLMRCTVCNEENYLTQKNKKNDPERLEFMKFCPKCRKQYDANQEVCECGYEFVKIEEKEDNTEEVTPWTVYLGQTNLSKLTQEQKAIATNKVVPVKSDDEIIKAFLRSF